MRRYRGGQQETDTGQDSFLDIVANLVGILIILVMVIGVRAKDALVEAAVAKQPLSVVDIEASKTSADGVQRDIHAIQAKLDEVYGEAHLQFSHRDHLATVLAAVKHDLNGQRQKLDDTAQKGYDLERKSLEARRELEDLARTQQAINRRAMEPIPLRHLPTPLAKTVFGREVHFRLQGDRLVYVPLNELVDVLSNEWKKKIWKLEGSSEVVETIGPQQGFRLKYRIEKTVRGVQARVGVQRREVVQVAGFVLMPVRDDLGQPISAALAADSSFRQILSNYDPQRTTVTIWTYPDSFDGFQVVKEELYRLGYVTAGRPLPEGYPIGGSPSGSRSAAQ